MDDPLCTTKANQLQVYNKVGMGSIPKEVKSKGEKFELESTIGVTLVLIACTTQRAQELAGTRNPPDQQWKRCRENAHL
jgi:hypothetical protein